jgi:hypothetical protein
MGKGNRKSVSLVKAWSKKKTKKIAAMLLHLQESDEHDPCI